MFANAHSMQKFVQLYITDIDDAIATSTLHGGSFRVFHVALYKTLHQMLFSLDREVALKIKLMNPTLPILMLTAYLEKLNDSDKPVDAVLGKPFAVDELRSAMAKLFASPTTGNFRAGQTRSQTEPPK